MMKTITLALAMAAFPLTAIAQSTAHPDHQGHNHHNETTQIGDIEGAFSKLASDHVIGSDTAPVTMILYASVTCPHCASWFKSEFPSLKRDYIDTGKLQLVFREFPTAPAQLAIAGFQIANCAPEEDYFDILNHQMVNQDEIFEQVKAGNGQATYLEIAKMAGIQTNEEMNACFGDQDGLDRLRKAGMLADSAGISSVPNAIIAGDIYKGKLEYLHLSRHIDSLSQQSFTPLPETLTKPTR